MFKSEALVFSNDVDYHYFYKFSDKLAQVNSVYTPGHACLLFCLHLFRHLHISPVCKVNLLEF